MPDKDQGAVHAQNFLPYGRQEIGDADIKAVVEALCSDWLTTGPRVGQFEKAFAQYCGAAEGVAVNSGTAALHAAMRAVGVGKGDEVIVPAITFAASANCAVYEGATPVFADVEADTLLLDPERVAELITPNTRAIVAVDYAGQPADYAALRMLAKGRNIKIIAGASHAPGATYMGCRAGTLADISCFSFHPVRPLTTCAGGLAQLARLPQWAEMRQQVARWYADALERVPHVRPLHVLADRTHAYHLFVVRLDLTKTKMNRAKAFQYLRANGIGANVHYGPVYLHSFYRAKGFGPGYCPVAESVYDEILTLPMFPAMNKADVQRVVRVLAAL